MTSPYFISGYGQRFPQHLDATMHIDLDRSDWLLKNFGNLTIA
jgi:hypothetical protein